MLKRFFSSEGRLRRIHYFLYLLCSGAGFTVFYLIVAAILGAIFESTAPAIILMIPFYIAYLWFCIATGVKRLHDMNKSGWTYLFLFIPIFNIVWALMMLFMDGTVGPNQYGPDPKNRMAATA